MGGYRINTPEYVGYFVAKKGVEFGYVKSIDQCKMPRLAQDDARLEEGCMAYFR